MLVVNRAREDLDVNRLRAVCMAIENEVLPLISPELRTEKEVILDILTDGMVQEYASTNGHSG